MTASDTNIRNAIESVQALSSEAEGVTLEKLKAFRMPGARVFEPKKTVSDNMQPVSYQSAGAVSCMLFGTPSMRQGLHLYSKVGVTNVSEHHEVRSSYW